MKEREVILGQTGLRVGRLGISASYGMPTNSVIEAIAAGFNYCYWGSLRRDAFAAALKRYRSQREKVVLVLQSYTPLARMQKWTVERGLRRLGYDYAEVLLLGAWNRPVTTAVLDAALELKRRGLIRFLAVSSHHRPLFPQWAREGVLEIFHLRYNAAHPGAEQDIFPHLPTENRPGIVSYTATSWRQLMDPKRTPPGEKTPTAGDCYRFVLSNPNVDVCMTGASNADHWRHAVMAFEKGPLTAEEREWMLRVGRGK